MFKVQDKDQIDKLHCFVCAKQYTSYDYVKRILEQKPLDYVINNIPELLIKVNMQEGSTLKFNIDTSKKDFIKQSFENSNKDIAVFLSLVYS